MGGEGMMMENENGKWNVKKNVKMLVEPSHSYIEKKQLEIKLQKQIYILEKLIPSQQEVEMAERDIQMIELLQDLEVI